MSINRRRVLQSAGVFGLAALAAPPVLGQAKPRVVVVGGGPGGVTAAKYVAKDSQAGIDVVLVEPQRQFTTCFHSNLFLGGYRSFESITHGYDKVAAASGFRMNHQAASRIDRDKKEVLLADGSRLGYDRLVLSPGIDLQYDSCRAGAASTKRPCRMPGGPVRRRNCSSAASMPCPTRASSW